MDKGVKITSLESMVMIQDEKETIMVPKNSPALMDMINMKLKEYLKDGE